MNPSYETIAARQSGDYPFDKVYQFSNADLCQFTCADDNDDLEIVLLAAATTLEEAFPLVQEILERYKGPESLDKQLAAGKYVASLRPLYLSGAESIESLDGKFTKLLGGLGYPNWLVMLSRNCEYATDIDAFREPFEEEFEYIASLWCKASTLAEFEAKYSREVSNTHDAKYC